MLPISGIESDSGIDVWQFLACFDFELIVLWKKIHSPLSYVCFSWKLNKEKQQ